MSDELGAVSVGLSVGLGNLDRDIAKIERRVAGVERAHTIPFAVGKVSFDAVQREIQRITANKVNVAVAFKANRADARLLRSELQSQLTAAGAVPIHITADLSPEDVERIRAEITAALGLIPVNFTAGAKGRGGTPGGAPSTKSDAGSRVAAVTGAVSPHERRVDDDVATKVGRAVRQAPVARSAPIPTKPASTAVQATPVAPPVRQAPVAPAPPTGATGREATKRSAQSRAVPVPAAIPQRELAIQEAKEDLAYYQGEQERLKARGGSLTGRREKKLASGIAATQARLEQLRASERPQYDFGPPTGPSAPIVHRRSTTPVPGAISQAEAFPAGSQARVGERLVKGLRKHGVTRLSPDELTAQKRHTSQPETPEEVEYASRPTQVSVHEPNAITEFEQEKRGRGVRGAGRSGARLPHEPVLTDLDRSSTEIARTINETKTTERRSAEIAAPARRSPAFFGTSAAETPLRPIIDKLQFYRFDPRLGQAFEALRGGDEGKARQLVRGVSSELVTADPRKRRKFFRLFQNVEKVPPELLERHAALQAVFAQISQTDAAKRVARIEAQISAAKPTRKENPEQWADLLGQRKTALKFQQDVLRGLARRASGGPVRGTGRTAAPRTPGVNWPNDPERYAKASRVREKSYPRTLRRFAHTQELLAQGLGPETSERKRSDKLVDEAESLDDRLKTVVNSAWLTKRAAGGPVTGSSGTKPLTYMASGGPVKGTLPVFGRGLEGIKPGRDYGDVGERVRSMRGVPFKLQRVPLDKIQPWHATKPELTEKYAEKLAGGSELPPIILGRRGRIEDGHHRYEVAKAAGLEDMLAYVQKKRAAGGSVMGDMRLHGRAAGGPVAAIAGSTPIRVHGTQQWRKASVAQRTRQPWCTYCGTSGSKENPLQGEHIHELQAGGHPFDPRNITTACKNCNLAKRGKVGWEPPGRAAGGPVEGDELLGPIARRIAAAKLGKKPAPAPDDDKDKAPPAPAPIVPEWIKRLDRNAKDFTPRAAGGPVESMGPLMRRIAQAKERTYIVGERHPETYVSESGKVEVVGQHGPEIRQFPESGRIIPSVPTWVARMQKNAKDFTPRAAGGPVRGPSGRFLRQGPPGPAGFALVGQPFTDLHPSAPRTPGPLGGVLVGEPVTTTSTSRPVVEPPTPPPPPVYRRPTPTEYEGPLAAEPSSGLRGRKGIRNEFPGERAAIAQGGLSPTGGVQRVFIVNFPPAFGRAAPGGLASAPAGAGVAASPLRFNNEQDILDRFGGQVRDQLRDLLGATESVKPQQAERETPIGPLSAEEKVRSRIEAIGGESARGLRERLTNIRSGLSETASQSPVRSLAPAFGQIVATRFGRGELLKRLAVARDLTAQATRAEGIYNAEVNKELDLNKKLAKEENPAKREQLTAAIGDQGKATKAAKDNLVGFVGQAEAAAKSADALSLKVGVLAGNTVGIIGGTLAFGATLGIAQVGIGAITQTLGPMIERLTGFQNTSAAVTGQLADQTRQQQGAVKTTVAQAEAQAGLSAATANYISPLLEQRAQTEAGNKALTDSLALLHTFEAVRGQNAGRGGADQGLTRTTGGLFGSILNGVPSTSEQVANELKDVAQPGTDAVAKRAELTRRQQAILDKAGVSAPSQLQGRAAVGYQQVQVQLGQITKDLDQSDDRIKFFNEAIGKGGEGFKFIAQRDLPQLDDATREQAAQAAADAGAFDIANNIRDKRAILVDSLGHVVTSADDVTKTLGALNTGLSTPDPALLLKQLTERIIPAQKAQFRAEGLLQRNLVNPAQSALAEIANPTPGTKGIPFAKGIVGTGDKEASRIAASYEKQVGGAVSFVNDQIAKGRDALETLVPPDLRSEFDGILKDIEATGKQISGIQLDIQQKQVNLEVAQYNNELRIAKRSLQDAKDLQAGIAGKVHDTVGGLEGQNIALERTLQLLGFELAQRQINFKLATAGFVAPGTTPEERAARIEEAKKEAEFAQKQLDLQKKIAGNQFREVTLPGTGQVARQITDLSAQINLLERGRTLTLNTAAAGRALDLLNKKQTVLVQLAQTYIEEGVKITSAALQAASQVEQQTGKAFGELLKETANAWGIFGEQAQKVLNALLGTAPTTGGPTSSGGTPHANSVNKATGFIGDTLGPTDVTVGEAGKEKVAILKNPRLVHASVLAPTREGPAAGGSGGITLNVIVTGNKIENDADENDLAERIARKVEDTLMRKTSLFGLRRL